MAGLKRNRRSSGNCLIFEILAAMAAHDARARVGDAGAGAETIVIAEGFLPGERLLFHAGLFVIGSTDLLVIGLSQNVSAVWLWPWVAAWTVVLLAHAVLTWRKR
jgi:hypothetical protein